MGYSGLCFGGSGNGYPLVELTGVDGEAEIGSTIDISDRNIYGKLVGFPLGECKFVLEAIHEVSYSVGSSYGRR